MIPLVVDKLYEKLGYTEYVVGSGIGARGWDWDTASVRELDAYIMFRTENALTETLLDVLTANPITPDPITNAITETLPMSIPAGYAIEPLAVQLEEELVMFPQARYIEQRFEILTSIITDKPTNKSARLVKRFNAYVSLEKVLESLDLVLAKKSRRFPL